MKKQFLFLLLILTVLLTSGCTIRRVHKNENATPNTDSTEENKNPTEKTGTRTFSGISFQDAGFVYDGNVHYPTLTGVPSFAKVHYLSSPLKDVGTYDVSVEISGEDYETLTLTAKVHITPAPLTGLSFPSLLVYEDGEAHFLSWEGNLPADISEFTVLYEKIGAQGNEKVVIPCESEIGTYEFQVTVSHPNYIPFTATATLCITKPSAIALIAQDDGLVFYQDPSQNSALFVKDGNTHKKVSDEKVTKLYKTATGTYLCLSVSHSPFSLFEVTQNGDLTFSEASKKTILSDNIDEFLFIDDARFLYSVSVGTPGIYAVVLHESSEPAITKIYDGKVSDLCLNTAKSKLYFTNTDKNSQLICIDLTKSNAEPIVYPFYQLENLCVLDDVAIAVKGDGLVTLDLAEETETALADYYGFSYAVYEGKIYFLADTDPAMEEGNRICVFNPTTKTVKDETTERPFPCLSSLTATGGTLYYFNALYVGSSNKDDYLVKIPPEDISEN